jgi:hypothetical protein
LMNLFFAACAYLRVVNFDPIKIANSIHVFNPQSYMADPEDEGKPLFWYLRAKVRLDGSILQTLGRCCRELGIIPVEIPKLTPFGAEELRNLLAHLTRWWSRGQELSEQQPVLLEQNMTLTFCLAARSILFSIRNFSKNCHNLDLNPSLHCIWLHSYHLTYSSCYNSLESMAHRYYNNAKLSMIFIYESLPSLHHSQLFPTLFVNQIIY